MGSRTLQVQQIPRLCWLSWSLEHTLSNKGRLSTTTGSLFDAESAVPCLSSEMVCCIHLGIALGPLDKPVFTAAIQGLTWPRPLPWWISWLSFTSFCLGCEDARWAGLLVCDWHLSKQIRHAEQAALIAAWLPFSSHSPKWWGAEEDCTTDHTPFWTSKITCLSNLPWIQKS